VRFAAASSIVGIKLDRYAHIVPAVEALDESLFPKSSIRGEVNKKHFTFCRIFVDFQPRLLSSRICSCFPLQRLGTLRTTA
jgi:hypothetical protein